MKLRRFQVEAVDRFENVRCCLIGDDMGLGKTVEALGLDLRRRINLAKGITPEAPEGHELVGGKTGNKTLIIAPLSVLPTWERHIRALWPNARYSVINPKNRPAFLASLKQPYHYYVCHWEGLRLMPQLADMIWWHTIADEVHAAKNPKSQQTNALKKLRTWYKTGLSGTPADNNPQDLWSILNWLYPMTWTSFWNFQRRYVRIEVHTRGFCLVEGCGANHKQGFRKAVGVAHTEELRQAMAPYYIRRLKEEVAKELPDKYYDQIEVDLTPKQRRIYNEMRAAMLAWVGKHEQEPLAAPIVIAQLTRLKQFALAYAELERVNRYDQRAGETREVSKVRLSEPSSKLDVVMRIVTDNPHKQFVVFSESRQLIELLERRLLLNNVTHVLLTGLTPQADRDLNIKTFQAGQARVFAGTIAAGGLGITLTAASTVIFLDRTWNPSRNRQAEDRCHRIGQKNAVQVIDIVARDTVDAGRLQRIELKWKWLRQILGDKVEE
jgi:SNF2 family DNA or RNA helicase